MCCERRRRGGEQGEVELELQDRQTDILTDRCDCEETQEEEEE